MYCRGCCYELTGLDDDPHSTGHLRCPECGRAFDPASPRTWQSVPHGWFMQHLFGRSGVVVAVVVLLGVAVWQTWLPRPDAVNIALHPVMRSWSMWTWFGMKFGVDRYNTLSAPVTARYFADRIAAVSGQDEDGRTSWQIDRLSDERFRVRVHLAGLDYRELTLALWPLINLNNEPLLLFRRPPAPASEPSISRSPGPAEFEGTWQEVVAALARHYDLRLFPAVRADGQQALWIMDVSGNRLIRVSASEAIMRGLNVRRLIPGIGLRFERL